MEILKVPSFIVVPASADSLFDGLNNTTAIAASLQFWFIDRRQSHKLMGCWIMMDRVAHLVIV